jgi:Protein of unknown function (DUF3048) N-terminal domain/Protein of unknown function (DUF3048) C-terminal domain
MNTSRSNASRLAAGLTGLALVAAACGGGGDSAEETTTVPEETTTTTTEVVETTTTVEAATTTTTEPAVDEPLRQPLTGEIVDSEDELITRPALAVKIDNADGARRNHTGLAVADIVFEEIVEDSNTRFAAVFHTQDADPIGPIRSGRSQDVDILSSLNSPLFAWSGGNPGVTRLIRDSFLTDLNWQRNAGSYQRGPGTSPSNLYSDTEQLYALTPEDHPGAPPIQWSYVPDNAAFAGDDVSGFDLAMRRRDISWDWNAELDKFVRSMDGTPHDDVTYGPIAATNVVVMLTEYRPSTIDRNSPEAQTIGEGLVYVFSNGGYIEGKWSRGLAVGPIKFNDLEGNPIPLTPGNTWIELAELIDDAGEGESPVDMVIRPA